MKHLTTFASKEAYDLEKDQLAKPNVSLAGDEVIYLPMSKGPEMVDLGLSVKWAKCNVGAEKETDYGKYFKFGDVVGTVDGVGYDDSIPAVEVDSDNHLLPAYDAATVNMGAGYRMPTNEEMDELINGTDHAIMTIDDVLGMRFSKKDDVSTYIFVPFAGSCYNGSFVSAGLAGYLWSSTLRNDYGSYGLGCSGYGDPISSNRSRSAGLSVRGVSE